MKKEKLVAMILAAEEAEGIIYTEDTKQWWCITDGEISIGKVEDK